MQLRVTDGTTTVDLSGATTGITGCTYAPVAPSAGDDSVSEQAELICRGTTIANIRAALNSIEQLCEAARQRQADQVGVRVFVEYRPVDSDSLYRSELYDGRLVLSEEPGARRFGDSSPALQVAFAFTRAPWWEGPETLLALTNGNRTDYTAGIEVYNCNDGTGTAPNKRNNYVEIKAADVTGTLPAPLKIELKNIASGAVTWGTFYLARNAFSDPANFQPLIEGEARASGGSTASNSNASGGSQLQLAGYSSGQQVVWTLSSALLQKTQSRWFRLLLSLTLRSATVSQAETVQVELLNSGGTYVLWRNELEVSLSQTNIANRPYVDLGLIPLPPAGFDTSWDALKLRLTFRLASATANTYVDCLYLLPIESTRLLIMRPESIAVNALVVDNGIEGVAYMEASSLRNAFVTPVGAPLMVWPGKLQRIYVLADQVASYPDITNKWALRAWYRPRRAVI